MERFRPAQRGAPQQEDQQPGPTRGRGGQDLPDLFRRSVAGESVGEHTPLILPWQSSPRSLPFFATWAGFGGHLKRGSGPDRRQNGRVANEVCHFRWERIPRGGLPHYWTLEQDRQILTALPAGQPWLSPVTHRRAAILGLWSDQPGYTDQYCSRIGGPMLRQ